MSSYTSSFRRWILLTGAAFLTFCTVFFTASEALVRLRVVPNDVFSRHLSLLYGASKTGAAFGDSRVAQGFSRHPDFINLAWGGDTIPLIAEKAAIYSGRVRLRHAILQADPHMFSPDRENDTLKLDALYPDSHALVAFISRHRENLLRYWWVYLSGKAFRSDWDIRPDGSQPVARRFADLPPEEQRRRALVNVRDRRPIEAQAIKATRGYRVYVRTMEMLNEAGVHVCLVTFPVSREQRAQAAGFEEFAGAVEVFREIAEKAPGITHVSYRDWSDDDTLFADEDHLNVAGARRFTAQVAHDCFQGPEASRPRG